MQGDKTRHFAFGFYPHPHGYGCALGIWLLGEPDITLVWTANPDDAPLPSTSTLHLTIDNPASMVTEEGIVLLSWMPEKSIYNQNEDVQEENQRSAFKIVNPLSSHFATLAYNSFLFPIPDSSVS
ncbi:hypothetical protein PIB30_019433 [Stylosanthes scabra]|uniref:Uncharacterized protein n=1 Tax=Stylosanthes scabra TaxID=79078 RepID=A0ABU6R8J3_9FABA|nr:hypothetical protein [Stylosanthes scabra]